MKPLFKNSFLAVTVVLATGAVALPASARAVAAFPGGRAFSEANAGCFDEVWGGVVNNCAAMHAYEIGLPYDNPGNIAVYVTASGASPSNTVGCRAIGVGIINGGYWNWGGTMSYISSYPSPQTITLTTYGPGPGGLYTYCEVNPGGRIAMVNFTQ